ncbi:hypothetical protein F5H01DRAFT_361490 [Linnemannia elongata]|nr:hypothetical protein F5H01DRAFT_361490 [Linnemannia elongata]
MDWFCKAVEQDDPAGHFKALTQSHAKAKDWYLCAAEQGPSQAEFQLGVMYNGGRGVLVDDSIVLYFKYLCN